MFDPGGSGRRWQSWKLLMSGTALPLALRPSNANTEYCPEHFPTLSLQVDRPYLHVAAGAILSKLQRLAPSVSPSAIPATIAEADASLTRFPELQDGQRKLPDYDRTHQ